MSKIIPSEVAAVHRRNIDELIKYMGLDCDLYKVATLTTDKLRDKFTKTFAPPVRTVVQIVWTPEIRLLKSLGMYTEEKAPLPILAYFLFADDPRVNDYIALDIEYAIGDVKTNKFEVVDRRIIGHGTETRDIWHIAPMRQL